MWSHLPFPYSLLFWPLLWLLLGLPATGLFTAPLAFLVSV